MKERKDNVHGQGIQKAYGQCAHKLVTTCLLRATQIKERYIIHRTLEVLDISRLLWGEVFMFGKAKNMNHI